MAVVSNPDFNMNVNPFKVTNISDTAVHTIIFTSLPNNVALSTLIIKQLSGTIKFSVDKTIDATNSPTWTSSNEPIFLDIRKDQTLYFSGSAGSETFTLIAIG